MKKVSGSTFLVKRIYPIIFFGMLLLFSIVIIWSDTAELLVNLPIYFGTAVLLYVIFKKFIWCLVDEVYDYGSALEFRMKKKIQRVELKEITSVKFLRMSRPQIVFVHTKNEGVLGKKLTFILPTNFWLFPNNSYVVKLIERVDEAKKPNKGS